MSTIIDNTYTLGKRIGVGGMAEVYLAEVNPDHFDYTALYAYTQVQGTTHIERRRKADELANRLKGKELDVDTVRIMLEAHGIPLPGQTVALKIAVENADIKRFENEWKSLLCLNHDNIVKVYGGGTHQNQAYYAMEYIDGIVSLIWVREHFTIKQKLDILIQTGQGIQYLHDHGLIHRDVKPSNMLTSKTESGKYITKLTDLGLAKDLNQNLGLTVSNTIMGSPFYMSPEQFVSPKNVDYHTDIYSLGASLYEFVTGIKPYHDKTTIYELVSAINSGERPIPVYKHMPELPPAVTNIIETAMAWEVSQRYQSINDMIKDIDTYLNSETQALTESVCFQEGDKNKTKAMVGKDQYAFETALKDKTPSKTKKMTEEEFASENKSSQTSTPSPSGHKTRIIAEIAVVILLVVILGLMIHLILDKDSVKKQSTPTETVNKSGIDNTSSSDRKTTSSSVKQDKQDIIKSKSQDTSLKSTNTSGTVTGKYPIPTVTEQKKALALIKQTFSDSYKKTEKKRTFSRSFAQTLLMTAHKTNDDPNGRFVLFSEAAKFFAKAGELNTAIAVVDEAGLWYSGDILEMKTQVLEQAKSSKDYRTTIREYLKLVYEAISQGKYGMALMMGQIAQNMLRTCKDPLLIKGVNDKVTDTYALTATTGNMKSGKEKLKLDPNDPTANFAVGKYLCLVANDWQKGLPLLAKSSDEIYKSLAQTDMQETKNPQNTIKLGDGWWNAAEKENSPGFKLKLQERAIYWYQKVYTQLKGLAKAKVESRIKTVESLLGKQKELIKTLSSWIVVDLSKGPAASEYPIQYLLSPPSDLLFNKQDKNQENIYLTDKLVLRKVFGGSFYMGSSQKKSNRNPKIPRHKVSLTKDFFISVFEITQKQYENVTGTNPSAFQGMPERPVECVTWNEVRGGKWPNGKPAVNSFIGKLRGKTQKMFDLPTEAQWEYACRAGTESLYNSGQKVPGPDDYDTELTALGFFKQNSNNESQPVGGKIPNPWGLRDTHGNVWEWCLDWFGPYSKKAVSDPVGPVKGTKRVLRSGSYGSPAKNCSSSYRNTDPPDCRYSTFGLRIVLNK